MRQAFFHLFPAEIRLAAALALFRVFAIPRLSARLVPTGAWTPASSRRLDHTFDLLGTVLVDGYDSPRAAVMFARLDAARAYHGLANDDMQYTLTTFVTEPAGVIDHDGRRPLRPVEREAACVFWREIGSRLDPRVRHACGLPDAPRPLAWALARAGAARRRMLAW